LTALLAMMGLGLAAVWLSQPAEPVYKGKPQFLSDRIFN